MDGSTSSRKIDKLPDQSLYKSEGGSNYLAAKRYAEQRGEPPESVWGPIVHGSTQEQVAQRKANAEADRMDAAVGVVQHDVERASAYDVEGGSNFLTAERYAAGQGIQDASAVWGPGQHHALHPAAMEKDQGQHAGTQTQQGTQ